jgi:hypothetical protein
MEAEQAIGLVRTLQVIVANDLDGLAIGQKAASRRLDQAAQAILAELIGRTPTTEEVKQSTSW